jgi:signal transduction histidine kinase
MGIPMSEPDRTAASPPQGVPLRRLLWRSYLRTSLIPLLVIEVGFLATYWVSETVVYRKNMEAISELSRTYFLDIAHREAATISASLESIASHTRVFVEQTRTALEGDYVPPAEERARYRIIPTGGLYTVSDNGTTASFYAGGTRIGQQELAKVWRLSALDPYMMAVKNSNPLVASIYFNTYDSYNRIYPYVDASAQYSPDMRIPNYNFYYEADAEHNPERGVVWTDAYVDPAGHGWLVSSIAPVWRGDKLEGVVGIDVTLETIIGSLLDLELPWSGYAMLVDQNGGIIALPPAGEKDFGLDELTDHDYAAAIMTDTHKPEDFNINQREDTRPLAEAMRAGGEGEVELDLGGARLASFATVPQTGWRLVVIAPTEMIYADAQNLHERLETVGYIMLASLFGFYLLFFAFLTRRARQMSRMIAEPLAEISGLIDHISDRRGDPRFGGSEVRELDKLGHHLVATRQMLLEAEDEARRQSVIAHNALVQLRAANSEMFSFTRLMSHEIRTPLSIIDGSAQIIQRKAERLSPDDLRERAGRLRTTVATVADMLSQLLGRFDSIVAELTGGNAIAPVDPAAQVRALAESAIPAERLRLDLPDACPAAIGGAGALVEALQDVFAHVMAHAPAETPVEVALHCTASMLTATVVSDAGTQGGRLLDRARAAAERAGGQLASDLATGRVTIKISVPTSLMRVNQPG